MQCSQCLLALYHAVMDSASAENRTRGTSVKAAKRGSGKMLTSASLVLGAALVMPTQENAAVVEALGAGVVQGVVVEEMIVVVVESQSTPLLSVEVFW